MSTIVSCNPSLQDKGSYTAEFGFVTKLYTNVVGLHPWRGGGAQFAFILGDEGSSDSGVCLDLVGFVELGT